MNARLILLTLVCSFSFAALVRADEFKLKDGEVIKDCKVKSHKGGRYQIELLDGSRRFIKDEEVAEYTEKATIGDDIEGRMKKLDKKDVEGHMALAREAKEKGAIAVLKDIGRVVTRADKKNEEIHLLMDEKLCSDGKWRGGRALEKFELEEKEDQLKAQGWKKIKGEWHDPVTVANLEAGLVNYEGEWVTAEHASNLKAGKLWVEGQWYEAGDKAQLDQGMRKVDGEWMKITDIDAKVRSGEQLWRLESKHFVIAGPVSHRSLTIFLNVAESLWDPLTKFFGNAPNTAQVKDKIVILVAKDAMDYGVVHEANAGDDRVAYLSNNIPGYYSSKSGAVVTYYQNIEYTTIWLQNGVAMAFMARLYGYEKIPTPAYEAFASYFTGYFKGKYTMYYMMVSNGINNWLEDVDPVSTINDLDMSVAAANPVMRESRVNRLGFVLHFLEEKQPKAFEEWKSLLRQGASANDFKKVISNAFKEEAQVKEFRGFLEQFRSTYHAPVIK